MKKALTYFRTTVFVIDVLVKLEKREKSLVSVAMIMQFFLNFYALHVITRGSAISKSEKKRRSLQSTVQQMRHIHFAFFFCTMNRFQV